VNCREAERLIDTFYDGELDGRSMRDAAMHITRCKRCEAELSQRERVQQLLAGTIEQEIADIDLGRIWAAVEPTLEQPGSRIRLPWSERSKVAAASARVGGLLLGRKPADDDEADAAAWVTANDRTPGRWRWTLGGGAALAASVLLAIALVPSSDQPAADAVIAAERNVAAAELARVPSSPTTVAQRPPVVAQGGFDVARARTANKQVQVESVNFPRSSVAMWSEPATETTVIWIGDEELAASGGR
jgi:hypothetical protein